MTKTALNHAIDTLAQDAWDRDRVMHLDRNVNYRVAEFGTARLREEWRCQQDHGYGVCSKMLVPDNQVAIVLGLVHDDETVDAVQGEVTTISWIDTQFSPSFHLVSVELWHLPQVMAAYERLHGVQATSHDVVWDKAAAE